MGLYHDFSIHTASSVDLHVKLNPTEKSTPGALNIEGRTYSVSIEGSSPEILEKTQEILKNIPQNSVLSLKKFYATITQKKETELVNDPEFQSLDLEQSLKKNEVFSNNHLKEFFRANIKEDEERIEKIDKKIRATELSGFYVDEESPILHKGIAAVYEIFNGYQIHSLTKELTNARLKLLEDAFKMHQLMDDQKGIQDRLKYMLELAIFTDHIAYANLFIEAGAEIDNYLMFVAICVNSEQFINRFLENSHINPSEMTKTDHTLFEIACLRGKKSSNAIKLFIERGCDLTQVNTKQPFISGDNPLFLLINSDLPSQDVLTALKKVDNLNIPDSKMSLFDAAIYRIKDQNDFTIFRYLVEKGCNPNKASRRMSISKGDYPLHQAFDRLDEETLKKEVILGLLFAGHKVNVQNDCGDTPLHTAAVHAYKFDGEFINMLSRAGANINAQNIEGQTPLHVAVQCGNGKSNRNFIINLLRLKDIDINAQDKEGNTPLHLAVKCGLPEIVKLLLENGANRNLRNKEGKLPGSMPNLIPSKKQKFILDVLSKTF